MTVTIITETPRKAITIIMSDSVSIYLERISDFARLLRSRGLLVGLSETADAAKLLADTDFTDRERVKNTLRALFAKSQSDQEIFDRSFDLYFVTAEQKKAIEEAERAAREEYEKQLAAAEQDLTYNGKPMDLDESLRDTYVRMPEEVRERLRQIKDRFRDDIDRSPELYAGFIKSVFMKSILEQQLAMEDAAAHAEAFDDPELEMLYRDISDFKENDIPKATALIARLGKMLNGEIQARNARSGRAGKLDFKRTIRKGLETGGSFYRLAYKRRHKRRKKLVLLCDVSGSMMQFSAFALEFIQQLSTVSESSRTFIFSEELAEIDRSALVNTETFRKQVKATGLFGRGTNLAHALSQLLTLKPPVLNGSSMLIILSDTKTVNVSETEQLLAGAKRLSGNIIWLNPIPERKWDYVRSIGRISGICQMIPCSTLSDLSRAVLRIAM